MAIFLIMIVLLSLIFIGIVFVMGTDRENRENIYGIEDRIFKSSKQYQEEFDVLIQITKMVIVDFKDDKTLQECGELTEMRLKNKKIFNKINEEYMVKYINLIYLIESLELN